MKRIPLLDALTAMDAAMSARGYRPMANQPPRHEGVLIRLYQNGDGNGISLAITHDEILLPPYELGLAITGRIARALGDLNP